jgi:hypothetical protein
VGKGKGGEGTELIALYTHLRVSLDCYPLVTPLSAHLCSNVGENVRLLRKPCKRG